MMFEFMRQSRPALAPQASRASLAKLAVQPTPLPLRIFGHHSNRIHLLYIFRLSVMDPFLCQYSHLILWFHLFLGPQLGLFLRAMMTKMIDSADLED